MPLSISLDESVKVADDMRRIIGSFPEVKQVASQTGRPDDGTDATGFYNIEFFVDIKHTKEMERQENRDEDGFEVAQEGAAQRDTGVLPIGLGSEQGAEEHEAGQEEHGEVVLHAEHGLARQAREYLGYHVASEQEGGKAGRRKSGSSAFRPSGVPAESRSARGQAGRCAPSGVRGTAVPALQSSRVPAFFLSQ